MVSLDQAGPGMSLRPYQLVAAICHLGADATTAADPKTEALLATVRNMPDIPITLQCNVGDVFAYQDPGTADDTSDSAEFNVMRDMEILYRLNLHPGTTLPARILFNRVIDTIEDLLGVCCFPSVTADAWTGCTEAEREAYRKGRAKGIEAIIPPRDEAEMEKDKQESLEVMYMAESIRVRPHILLCAICQYGGGIRAPFPEDNLPEMIQLILKQPDTLITLAPYADWMMCAPCPSRTPGSNGCVNNKGSGGLPNQMRDLRVLQKLGLTYGSTIKAGELYRLILERIPGTLAMCRIEHERPSVWWTGCGAETVDSEHYEKGRQMLMQELGM